MMEEGIFQHLSREMNKMRKGAMGKSGSERRGIPVKDRRTCKGPEVCSRQGQSV